jgi:ATP-dependent helicase/DNAse subunit B
MLIAFQYTSFDIRDLKNRLHQIPYFLIRREAMTVYPLTIFYISADEMKLHDAVRWQTAKMLNRIPSLIGRIDK